MNDVKSRYLNMAKTVDGIFDDHATEVATIPVLETKTTLLKVNINSINYISEEQSRDRTGAAVNKNLLKKELSNQALSVSMPAVAYAIDSNNMLIKNEFNVSYSEIYRMKDVDFLNTVNRIYSFGNTNAAALLPYGVTALNLTNLNSAISNFNAIVEAPRIEKTQAKSATSQLDDAFNELEQTIESTDNIMISFKSSMPSFYFEYLNAREIINVGTRIITLDGNISDSATLSHLKDAKVELLNTAHFKFSSTRGHFAFKSLPEGNYTIKVSKEGYFDFEQPNIPVVHDKKLTLNITLSKKYDNLLIYPLAEVCAWYGKQNPNMIINLTNLSNNGNTLWAFISYQPYSPIPANKVIIADNERADFALADYQPDQMLYLRIYNPDITKSAKYRIAFSDILT